MPCCARADEGALASVCSHLCRATERNHGLSEADKLRMVAEACSGLAQVHSASLLHRDVAARNCLADDALTGEWRGAQHIALW